MKKIIVDLTYIISFCLLLIFAFLSAKKGNNLLNYKLYNVICISLIFMAYYLYKPLAFILTLFYFVFGANSETLEEFFDETTTQTPTTTPSENNETTTQTPTTTPEESEESEGSEGSEESEEDLTTQSPSSNNDKCSDIKKKLQVILDNLDCEKNTITTETPTTTSF